MIFFCMALIDWFIDWHWVQAPTVPIHLSLIDGLFVPHNLISTEESTVPLLKFQMAPRLKILISSEPKKGTQIYFSFLSKIPPNEPPTGSLRREIPVYGVLCISIDNLIKIPLNKKALRKKRLCMFPKSRAPMEADAHFRALLDISYGVPSKGALSQGPLHGIPHRGMPHSQSPPRGMPHS